MADDVTTRLQKEVAQLQKDLARLESKMDGVADQLRAEWSAELQKGFENIRNEMGKMLAQMMLRMEETALGMHYLKNLECSKFDGNDFLGWHLKVEQYFKVVGLAEEDKVPMAMIHLDGKALQWQQRFVKSRSKLKEVQWQKYIAEMRAEFHDNEYSDPMFDLISLKQINTVEDYYDEFEALLNRVQLSEEYELSIFVSNLKPEISRYVRLFYPKTLTHALNLAKQLAAMIYDIPRKPFTPCKIPFPVSKQNPLPALFPTPKTLPKPQSKGTTREEKEDRRRRGLCMWCDSEDAAGHKCLKSQLYQLLMDESEEKEGETEVFADTVEDLTVKEGESSENPTISLLHALMGAEGYQTMHEVEREG